jgi:hypothetical protein
MMFNYIASVLGFQGQSNTTNIHKDNHSVSCEGYGYTLPDHAVRLRVSSRSGNKEKVRIFGYPPQEDYTESMQYLPGDMLYPPEPQIGVSGPYVHYLYHAGPACERYVMGANWRSQLRSDYPARGRGILRGGDVVLRPTASMNSNETRHSVTDEDPAAQAEERAHSLRMRRCGAVAIFSENDIIDYETERPYPLSKYLFGWPKGGGVWVLRAPWLDAPPKPKLSECKDDWELMEANMKEGEEYEVYLALVENVRRQEDMGDVCRVLEESGAHFYATTDQSPEAVEFNLC